MKINAEAAMPLVMSTEELAAILRVTPETLRKWRANGAGPRGFRPAPGAPYRYTREEVRAWIQARMGVGA